MLSMIETYSLQEKVILITPKEDVRSYLSNALFVVLVSYWEGLSRVLIESAAMGRPILASRNGGNKEVVIHKHNGLLVDAGDIKQTTESLNEMNKGKCLKQYSLNSRKLAMDLFDIKTCIEHVEQLYRKI